MPCSPFHSPGSHMSCWCVSEIWHLEAYLDNPCHKRASLCICGLRVQTITFQKQQWSNIRKNLSYLGINQASSFITWSYPPWLHHHCHLWPLLSIEEFHASVTTAHCRIIVSFLEIGGVVPTLTWLGPMMVPVQDRMNKSSPSSIP